MSTHYTPRSRSMFQLRQGHVIFVLVFVILTIVFWIDGEYWWALGTGIAGWSLALALIGLRTGEPRKAFEIHCMFSALVMLGTGLWWLASGGKGDDRLGQ